MGRLLNVKDVQEKLNIKESMAYRVIRDLNKELDKKGFCTLRGRVPEKYVIERFGLNDGDE